MSLENAVKSVTSTTVSSGLKAPIRTTKSITSTTVSSGLKAPIRTTKSVTNTTASSGLDADAKATASPYAFMATKPGIKGSSVPSTPAQTGTTATNYQPEQAVTTQYPESGVTVNGQAAPPYVQEMFNPLHQLKLV